MTAGTTEPLDIIKPLWYNIYPHPPHMETNRSYYNNDIVTENEFTTHPKMLELTSNAGKLKYSYAIMFKKMDNTMHHFVHSTAMNALISVISQVNWSDNKQEVEIIKIITNRDTMYVETEKMTATELQNEAFMESSLHINKAVPIGTI